MHWQPADLEDDLVKLVPLTAQDFEVLYAVAADPLIWAQHPAYDRYQRDVFEKYFEGAVACQSAFLVVDKTSQRVIGATRYYDPKPDQSSIAIGFTFLARAFWGGQYNKSMKQLMLEYAFRHVQNVIFHIGADNLRSQFATARLGVEKIGEFWTESHGKPALQFEYRLTKEQWNDVNKKVD